jgi:hypothetical protein
MNTTNFYFTFGTDKKMPYCGGWVRVVATDYRQAIDIFNAKYGLSESNLVNCASFYSEEIMPEEMLDGGNLGFREHALLDARVLDDPQCAKRLKLILALLKS